MTKTSDEFFSDERYKFIMLTEIEESEYASLIIEKYEGYIIHWEMAFFVASRMFTRPSLHIGFAPLAVMYQEAIAAQRSSYILNQRGYHSDAISLLRRVHECTVKAIASRIDPNNMWKCIQSSSLNLAEKTIGIGLKDINNAESSFIHGNKLRIYRAGHAVEERDVSFESTHKDFSEQNFHATANLSILWFYILLETAPKVFQRQKKESWNKDREIACRNLKKYLTGMPNDRFLKVAEAFESLRIT